jgi:hypothetical protein
MKKVLLIIAFFSIIKINAQNTTSEILKMGIPNLKAKAIALLFNHTIKQLLK